MQSGGEEEQWAGGKERQWAVWRGWARGHVPAAWLMKPRRLPTCSQAGCRWPPELEGSGGRRGARPAMRAITTTPWLTSPSSPSSPPLLPSARLRQFTRARWACRSPAPGHGNRPSSRRSKAQQRVPGTRWKTPPDPRGTAPTAARCRQTRDASGLVSALHRCTTATTVTALPVDPYARNSADSLSGYSVCVCGSAMRT